MKIYLIFIVYIIFNTISGNQAKAETDPFENVDGEPEYGKDWVLFPDEYETIHFINITVLSDKIEPDSTGDVYFHLYTRGNPDNYEEIFVQEDVETSDNKYNSSYFSKRKDLKVVTHGWQSSGNSPTVLNIKNAYLDTSDVNVIIIDWGNIAKNKFYPSSAKRTHYVGNQTGKLIKTLITHYSISCAAVHLIGHSLGAHVVGFAARWLKGYDMKVARVTGLDPARPFFEIPPPEDGIKADDADFVDIIHTNGGILGELRSHGIADFYPNGGTHQKGCKYLDDISAACSHSRSHQFFTESIRSGGFLSRRCGSWESYKEGKCKDNDTSNMGEFCKNITKGDYYLYTNPNPPYSKDEQIS